MKRYDMSDLLYLDFIRGVHLMCIVVGMGSALYFDLRSMHRIVQPMQQTDLDELHRIHSIVSLACVGLWVSGVLLIGIRTGFDLAAFSPKLWSKVLVVTALTLNALFLARFVIPALTRFKGMRLVDLPIPMLLPMTICAGISLSCWVLALVLGASQVLKTAQWDLLVPVLLGTSALCIGGALMVMFGARAVLRDDSQQTNLA